MMTANLQTAVRPQYIQPVATPGRRNWLVALGSRRVRALMEAPSPLSVDPLARR